MKRIAVLLGFCMVVAFIPTFVPQPSYAMTGSGTAGDPYVIYNVTDLQDISLHPTAYYVLNNSIDASDTAAWNWDAGRGVYEGFVPIASFSGHLDGDYYTISDLYMNRDGETYVGLFSDATNCHVTDIMIYSAVITATSTAGVGILAGYSGQGTISGVVTSGSVNASGTDVAAGGILGKAFVVGPYSVGLTQCASYANVVATGGGTPRGGGLIGYGSIASFIDCYARGDVSGSEVGGILGRGGANTYLTRCYATGYMNGSPKGALVGYYGNSVSTSFWDTDTTNCGVGCTPTNCGTGKSTPEMKTEATYTDAGWNFASLWDIGGHINDGYPYFGWWYVPPGNITLDANQVVWFQPNAIIEGVILPNRAQNGTLQDGEFTWGANPAGVTITHGELVPEEEYDFEPVIPSGQDIIKPEPTTMIGDVDTERLHNNPLYPLVQVLSIGGFLNERLVWLGLAWFILIAAMFGVHLGFDTHRGSERPQHFVLTTIVGLGLSILFYTMGIFPWWVILVMALGLIGSIIWERQPVL